MKPTRPWHTTPFGIAIRWLGGIQLAVPVLVFVAIAMAWGTYLESTVSAKEAKAVVYGSWWFMLLMGLMCVSLVLAVVTRYPWKRGHVGFILVHASLITLIFGGFASLLGRIEGHITLEEGSSSDTIEMDEDTLELVEHQAGEFRTVAWMPAPHQPGDYDIGGVKVHVAEVWSNSHEEFEVTDGGPEPYRAIYVRPAPTAPQGFWVGDVARGGPASMMGLSIRVLADGNDFKPPSTGAAPAGVPDAVFSFKVGDQTFPLAAEGQEAFPGWKIASISRFKNATTSNNTVTESATPGDNPAVTVLITDGKGTTERHTAFKNFPEIYLAKVLEGNAASGGRLVAGAASVPGMPAPAPAGGVAPGEDTLVFFGSIAAPRAAYVPAAGTSTVTDFPGAFPWTIDCGTRKIVVMKQVARAREISHITKAPDAKEHRPALVLSTGSTPAEPVAWKSMVPANTGGNPAMVRFGPRRVQLPFTLHLEDFHKFDYPGTDMAMAYESDVTVSDASAPDAPGPKVKIHMNNPLARAGWKVYQSGFVGDNVSVFSVMKDPGLTTTYIGSVGLCVGVLITFYSRRFSWGHPGIPAPFASKKENGNATSAHASGPARAGLDAGDRASTGPALDGAAGSGRDPGRRASDAAGLVRT